MANDNTIEYIEEKGNILVQNILPFFVCKNVEIEKAKWKKQNHRHKKL